MIILKENCNHISADMDEGGNAKCGIDTYFNYEK